MKINYAPRGILQIDDARIVYRNFSGASFKYNHSGDRNFSIVIPNEDIYNELVEQGWKVKIRPPREEGDTPFMTLPVKVKFSKRGLNAYLRSGNSQVRLNEETISRLDKIDIMSVDLDIRPYDWEMDGETGRTAYLQAIRVTQNVDRFAERFAEEEAPEDLPF